MLAIAIDGPAGAGKSTIAKTVAKKLGFIYVDTGALYRTLALYILDKGIEPSDERAIEAVLADVEVSMEHMEDGQHVFLLGKDVTALIRTPEVSMAASTSSAVPAVRKFLFELQTSMAEKYNVIMDGRDIGTVVLPNANLKIFLTASPEDRARRRFLEHEAKGDTVSYEEILDDVKKRDAQDSGRAVAPLKPAADAVILDTTGNEFQESVDEFLAIVNEKLGL